MFRITMGKGFQLDFANGLTISVQWGTGNYCARRDLSAPFEHEIDPSCSDAEVLVWRREPDRQIGHEHGRVTAEYVAAMIGIVGAWIGPNSVPSDKRLAKKLVEVYRQ